MKDCTGKIILNMFNQGKTNLPEHILYNINNNIINKSTMYSIYNSEIQRQGFIARFAECLEKSKLLRTV